MDRLEESVLSHVPGYFLVKSIAGDLMGENVENKMSPVLVQDGEALKIGLLVEEGEGLCTVFFPDAPRLDAGEVKIVSAAAVEKIDMPSSKAAQGNNPQRELCYPPCRQVQHHVCIKRLSISRGAE